MGTTSSTCKKGMAFIIKGHRSLRKGSMTLTEKISGNCWNPMPNHPGNGPDMVKVMFPPIVDQSTVQFVPTNV